MKANRGAKLWKTRHLAKAPTGRARSAVYQLIVTVSITEEDEDEDDDE